jgi:MFS family permease
MMTAAHAGTGYDVSNTANIQAPIYEAFGNMELLPWVGLGYSAGVTATMPVFGRLSYMLDMKVLMLLSSVVFFAGALVSGTATSIHALVAGRILNGVGGAGMTQM